MNLEDRVSKPLQYYGKNINIAKQNEYYILVLKNIKIISNEIAKYWYIVHDII